jgi:hypothetical protein
MMKISRKAYLATCKAEAMTYVERGELAEAVASMISDLSKRRDTKPHLALIQLAMMYLADMDKGGIKRWIEGFR